MVQPAASSVRVPIIIMMMLVNFQRRDDVLAVRAVRVSTVTLSHLELWQSGPGSAYSQQKCSICTCHSSVYLKFGSHILVHILHISSIS